MNLDTRRSRMMAFFGVAFLGDFIGNGLRNGWIATLVNFCVLGAVALLILGGVYWIGKGE